MRGHASGVAAFGDRLFVADGYDRAVHMFGFADGSALGKLASSTTGHEFVMPAGIALLDDRLLAVADRGADIVHLLSLDTLEVVRQIGAGRLKEPNDVVVDTGGNLLVMDTGNERIAVFKEDGSFVCGVMSGFFKDHGNTFSYLACDHDTGRIVVSNNDEHKVVVLAPPR